MTVRRLGLAVAVATALASGAYVFIYLYRWEWNRALIAAAIFIAVEIALLGAAIIDRIGRVGRRLDDIERDLATRQVLDRIEESAPEPRRHFAWLTDFDKMGVFVPVLMGAGVVISAIAWAIERIAQKTARPVLERRLATRLAPIALPVATAAAEPPGFSPKRSVARIATPLMLVVLVTASVVALAATTKNQPDELRAGTESTVALSIFTDGTIDPGSAARRLWHVCSETIPSELAAGSFEGSTGPDVSLNLRPGLGPNGERRLKGCLEDATLDHVQAAVVDVIHANR